MDRLSFHYFAYGSNMLRERLVARCPSARPLRSAFVAGDFELVFCKRSIDGSGKAALVRVGAGGATARIYGVVYELDTGDRTNLDRVEGDGYTPDCVPVQCVATGQKRDVFTYLGEPAALTLGLKPYDWYVALMLAGCRQHDLPHAYAESLAKLDCMADPVADRPRRTEALKCLAAAGFPFSSG